MYGRRLFCLSTKAHRVLSRRWMVSMEAASFILCRLLHSFVTE
ncbi:hypothetical protein GQ55_3G319500 [Panicum hallii var. hallii]|uniref:Uncharacterized protein n=1 Tax=Panicum hallii var. hallii TaxID=1504633 RepID=A0A2T7EFC3_9POAL|nr:hypothetical protein GQ55_3G319500 [Panicum hallii var. hallii]